MLNVENGATARHIDNYCEKAVEYVGKTGIDFLVADLGTEQQTSAVGGAKYNKKRARQLTEALGKKMLVLHGTSSLSRRPDKGSCGGWRYKSQYVDKNCQRSGTVCRS